ncbi:MAG TPA: hypothetical protein PKE27_11000 [Povalibacter sp.]|uniref:hypothetical protein n=1 Tax=Povalibacter sp. TaxID=1962978 RepID=UPI002CBEC9CD|nr:hypothetical protein [Povalibacter sp.]HMN45095.1 hypothetical protein [Povalibacter sp.]
MSFTQLLTILWARRQFLVFTVIGVVAVAWLAWLVMPKTYVATTSVVINTRADDPLTGATPNAPSTAAILATQMDVIASRAVALKVTDMLRLPTDEAAAEAADLPARPREGWANELLQKLTVKPVADSSVVRIRVEDEDPKFAADVANGFAEAYMQTSLNLRLDPAKRQSVWFDEQLTRLRGVVEDRRQKLSEYQRTHGIVATTERMDVENARLETLSRQLLEAQRTAQETSARVRQSTQAMSGDRLSEVPEVMGNALLQNLKGDLIRAEGRLAELSERYGSNHPQYIAARAEIDSIRQKMSAEISRVRGSIEQTAQISQREVSDLQRAYDEQKQHILELTRQRDELSVQDREVQTAQAAYDAALQRASQLRLQSQFNETSVAVLDNALPPQSPAGMGFVTTTALSLVFGALLGAALALMLEMIDRRVRDGDELVRVAGLEVLGEVPRLRASFKPARIAAARGQRTLLEGGAA